MLVGAINTRPPADTQTYFREGERGTHRPKQKGRGDEKHRERERGVGWGPTGGEKEISGDTEREIKKRGEWE